MPRFPMFVFCLVITFVYCNKSSLATNAPVSYLTIYDVTQTRDSANSTTRFRISVTPKTAQQIKVNYITVGASAKADSDFVTTSGILTIDANQSEAFIDVPVIGRQLKQSTQLFYLILSNAVGAQLARDRATATLENPGKPELVWSDEFSGTSLNTSVWNYETGGNGWGNNELENYTAGTNNAYLQNGSLVIEAKKEKLGNNNYTSARLTTSGKKSFTYGRVDIKAKVPVSKGIWPALWMLGQNINTVNWPACGEIDIMENIGETKPSKNYGTAHWGLSASSHLSSGGSSALTTGLYSDSFHVYSINWTADKIQWLIDDVKYYEVTKQQITGGNFPFDKPFFIILNVAVGGNWPGSPDATTTFPQKMYVDYIRVYQK
jgi:beta-glucanase (GH16 family)